MRGLLSDGINNTTLRSVCEAVVLVSATLMLVGLYLYMSGSTPAVFPWLILFAVLIVVFFFGSVAASYRQIGVSDITAELTYFRINRQLTETLRAERVPRDVISGLQEIIHYDEIIIQGEAQFIHRLEGALGVERTNQVKSTVLKYAKLKDRDTPPSTICL